TNRHDTGSTTARSVDELALIRDTIRHYAPVLIAPLSIQIRRAGVQKKFVGPHLGTACGSERASGSIIDGPGQEGAIAGRPAHDHWMNSPSSGRIQPTILFACDELHLCRSIHRTQTAGLSAPFFVKCGPRAPAKPPYCV